MQFFFVIRRGGQKWFRIHSWKSSKARQLGVSKIPNIGWRKVQFSTAMPRI